MPICITCGAKFESDRNSKLACSPECEKLRKSEYDKDRYLQFRNGDRKKRREMLVERYSISSTNLYKIKSVCDDCLTEFYYDYSIFQKFNDTFVTTFNTTEWGSAYCPRCGLVEKSNVDESIKDTKIASMGEMELKLYFNEMRKCKKPTTKSEAIRLRGGMVDFISEAEDVRKRINRIHQKGNLTQEELNICIATLFRKLR